MRRSVLITLSALGGLICLIGGTGLFAALTDSARSGTNSVESEALAGSADLQVAPFVAEVCHGFTEDLTTPVFTFTGAAAGTGSSSVSYCIRNVGSQSVSLSAMVDELTDVDFACTGDEEALGDTSCGNDGAGELASQLESGYEECGSGSAGLAPAKSLKANTSEPVLLGSLAPGEVLCFAIRLTYRAGTGSERQRAQSDRVTWRYRWTGQS